MLKQRGFVVANRGSGTTVAEVPPVRVTGGMKLPPGVRDLASGNPDPELLPPLTDALDRVDPSHKLYGGLTNLPELTAQAGEEFERDSIPGDIAVTGGALDARSAASSRPTASTDSSSSSSRTRSPISCTSSSWWWSCARRLGRIRCRAATGRSSATGPSCGWR
jgi:hypothetical protein